MSEENVTFMSVQRDRLQKAFALAHRASEDYNIGATERKYFSAIATLIWLACGESKAPDPERLRRFLEFIEPEAQHDLEAILRKC
jgi:hypothetical protein